MRIRIAVPFVVLVATTLTFSSVLTAQSVPATAVASTQKAGLMSGVIPDLNGLWLPDGA